MLTSKSLARNLLHLLNTGKASKSKYFGKSMFYNNATQKVIEPVGDIYTWSSGNQPRKLKLPQKARRISLGSNHTAIVSESGNLYTYGSNKYGQLGNGSKSDEKQPKIVEYFEKKSIKIKEALCGENHTIVLAEDGQVYTFGNGGKKRGAIWNFYNLFSSKASPLGHGNQQDLSKPKLVQFFNNKKIDRITSGSKFNFAIDENRKVYFWGSGEYGVVGDGSTSNYNVPTANEYFQYFQNQEKLIIKKLKSCATHSLALMSNGQLYGWGSNHAGQIGIKNQIGIELHEMVNFPYAVIREGYEDQKVVNFDVSQNMSIFQLDNGEIWWSGGHIAYKPQKAVFEQQNNIRLFAASVKSYVIVSNENNIYAYGKFLNSKKQKGDEDLKTGIVKFKGQQIFGGKIVGIGGQYNQKYAIIQS